jgi:hypothetical protein
MSAYCEQILPVLELGLEWHEFPNKGLGIVAKRRISAGAVIFDEFPLVSDPYPASNLIPQHAIESLDRKILASTRVHPNIKADLLNYAFASRIGNSSDFSVGLYPLICMLNHSCFPNVAVWNDRDSKKRGRLYAIEDIEPGDELCICYQPSLLYLSASQRKQNLKESHGFTCICRRCSGALVNCNDGLLTKANPSQRKDIDLLLKEFSVCEELFRKPVEGISSLIKDSETLNRFLGNRILNPYHWRMFKIREMLIQNEIGIRESGQRSGPGVLSESEFHELFYCQIRCQEQILPQVHNEKKKLFNTLLDHQDSVLWPKEISDLYSRYIEFERSMLSSEAAKTFI